MVRYYRPPWFRPQKCYYIHVAPSFQARCCVHCCGISKAAPHSVPMMDRTGTSVLTDDFHHSQMQCNMSLYDSMMANDDISTQPVSALGTDRLILLRLQVSKQQKRAAWKTCQCFYIAKDICKISNGYFMPVIEGWMMNALTSGRSNKSSHLSAQRSTFSPGKTWAALPKAQHEIS